MQLRHVVSESKMACRQRPTVWIICTLSGFALACIARNYEDLLQSLCLFTNFACKLGLLIGFVLGCALAHSAGLGVDYVQNILAGGERRDPVQVFCFF